MLRDRVPGVCLLHEHECVPELFVRVIVLDAEQTSLTRAIFQGEASHVIGWERGCPSRVNGPHDEKHPAENSYPRQPTAHDTKDRSGVMKRPSVSYRSMKCDTSAE